MQARLYCGLFLAAITRSVVTMNAPILSRRALNRATLHRQLLLNRQTMPVLEAVRHVVALNAQDPNPPYLTLWARLAGFTPDDLTSLLYSKQVVRSTLLRGTQHLAAADDYRWLQPLLQTMFVRRRCGSSLASTTSCWPMPTGVG